jgi:hypothetical protein
MRSQCDVRGWWMKAAARPQLQHNCTPDLHPTMRFKGSHQNPRDENHTLQLLILILIAASENRRVHQLTAT